jgi:hypothetical protein
MIVAMYEAEYAGKQPHYLYVNALQSKLGIETITGHTSKRIAKLKIIDVGAGSNELLRFLHKKLHVPASRLHGTDISAASGERILADGFHAHVGRLELLSLTPGDFDIVFLSYFVDYDTDQAATFDRALALLNTTGKIILEGLFPCQPLGRPKADKSERPLITKGESVAEDIGLVWKAFKRLADRQGKALKLERIAAGSRYIYNRGGLNRRPSFFVVIKADY